MSWVSLFSCFSPEEDIGVGVESVDSQLKTIVIFFFYKNSKFQYRRGFSPRGGGGRESEDKTIGSLASKCTPAGKRKEKGKTKKSFVEVAPHLLNKKGTAKFRRPFGSRTPVRPLNYSEPKLSEELEINAWIVYDLITYNCVIRIERSKRSRLIKRENRWTNTSAVLLGQGNLTFIGDRRRLNVRSKSSESFFYLLAYTLLIWTRNNRWTVIRALLRRRWVKFVAWLALPSSKIKKKKKNIQSALDVVCFWESSF